VSKAVGNSVVRHRVSRKLRHLVRDRLGTLTPGSTLVIRALPAAATASSAELGSDLDAAVRRLKLAPADGGAV
jgi:ribonuclease P protein component